jgi:hypothetical protein
MARKPKGAEPAARSTRLAKAGPLPLRPTGHPLPHTPSDRRNQQEGEARANGCSAHQLFLEYLGLGSPIQHLPQVSSIEACQASVYHQIGPATLQTTRASGPARPPPIKGPRRGAGRWENFSRPPTYSQLSGVTWSHLAIFRPPAPRAPPSPSIAGCPDWPTDKTAPRPTRAGDPAGLPQCWIGTRDSGRIRTGTRRRGSGHNDETHHLRPGARAIRPISPDAHL